MRLALLSDVHGNLPVLELCLAEIARRGCHDTVCLGDVFGYFPDGVLCLERLKQAGIACLMGNHEAMLLGTLPLTPAQDQVYQLQEQAGRLSADVKQEVGGWLPYAVYRAGSLNLLLVHGSPWQPLNEYIYPDADLGRFSHLPYDAVFMGHTHRPFARDVNGRLVCNVGSCGLPRDIGKASFAIFDSERNDVEIVRLDIDVPMLRSRYPLVHESVYSVLARGAQAH